MEPKISIIVPVFNVENYLCQCIDSLVNQSYRNLEIILIDDESPDNCGQICDEYKSKDDRIIVIHQKNKGLSGARNTGLEIATGDYIGFVDSDDWVDLEMYRVMLDILLKYDLDIVECGINDTGNDIKYEHTELDIIIENSNEALQRIIKNSDFSVWRRLYKSDIVKDASFVLNRTSEDVYFAVDNIPKITKMGYFDFPFYNYRPNPTSITKSQYNFKRFDDSITASLYLEKELKPFDDPKQGANYQGLSGVIQNFILNESVYHYKMMNYYPSIDSQYIHRNKLKQLIRENYFKSKTHNIYIKLAYFLPLRSFEILINLNKLKHRIFKTNEF